MSGITPLLDSLLHQVLGKPADLPTTRQGDRPVGPIVPGGAARAVHGDSRLDARSPRLLSPLLQTPQHGDETTSRPTSPGEATGPASAATRLSPAARTIADVFREHPARSSAITPGVPLLPSVGTPPVATLLAGLLRQSIGESGLFYESHLARWYRGELPLQALAREPQMGGWQPPEGAPRRAPGWGCATPAPMPGRPEAVGGETLPAESLVLESEEALQTGPAPSREQVQGLVRHQLELLANPVLHWEGEAWPGLSMFLSVQAPEAERQGSARSGEDGEGLCPRMSAGACGSIWTCPDMELWGWRSGWGTILVVDHGHRIAGVARLLCAYRGTPAGAYRSVFPRRTHVALSRCAAGCREAR
ncbi:hypothetical protein ACE0DR_05480 [Azotobacter sp. CWF10]